MARAQIQSETANAARRHRRSGRAQGAKTAAQSIVREAFAAERGLSKADASDLFQRVAVTSSLSAGKLRAELIPDSSWKRARKTLGPQASQTTARLNHILSMAERVWGNEKAATEWLNTPHPELRGSTPISMLKTEAGGRAIEALLASLAYGFPA